MRPRSWPRGRGCNVPELPVESALDQVHSQAGASEAPASGVAVQGGPGPTGSRRAWTLSSASPALWGLWPPPLSRNSCSKLSPLFTPETPFSRSTKESYCIQYVPTRSNCSPMGWGGGYKNGVVGHQKLSQALHMRGLWKCGKWVRCGKWGGIFPPKSYLIIKRLLFPRSKALNGGTAGGVRGEGARKAFCAWFSAAGAAERDPGPPGQCYCQRGRKVGGSKVYSVREQAVSASSGGGGLGRGRRLCEQRKRRGSKGC